MMESSGTQRYCALSHRAQLCLFGNTVIVGDLNANDPLWHSALDNTRGQKLAHNILNSDMATLNTKTPTRLPPNPNESLSSSA